MNKRRCISQLNSRLRLALLSYHAMSGMTQEELAFRMRLSARACSALENGEYGFSTFSTMALFSVMTASERQRLFDELCNIMALALGDAA
jgi:DNA-binding XRE family transcriptional regulator